MTKEIKKNSLMCSVVGNGVSRKGFDLHHLPRPIFGCNALYREFEPDWLVAIDPPIIKEIMHSDFPMKRFIVPEYEQQFEPEEFSPVRRRNNAGMVAMKIAIDKGYNHIVCVGMDFLVDDPSVNLDNIFAGSDCYGPEHRSNLSDIANRLIYMEWFANRHPHVTFHFVFPDEITKFRTIRADNVFGQNFSDFLEFGA